MSWFNRNRKDSFVIQPPPESRVEVELHKTASVHAAAKAQETNKHLNQLLIENGFTLKIYLAAGGHLPKKKRIKESKK